MPEANLSPNIVTYDAGYFVRGILVFFLGSGPHQVLIFYLIVFLVWRDGKICSCKLESLITSPSVKLLLDCFMFMCTYVEPPRMLPSAHAKREAGGSWRCSSLIFCLRLGSQQISSATAPPLAPLAEKLSHRHRGCQSSVSQRVWIMKSSRANTYSNEHC